MPRYIDADALIEVLQEWRDTSSINDGAGNPIDSILYDVIRHIEDAPPADFAPRAEWISVEERLPESNKQVLVYYSVGKIDTAHYIRVDGLEFWFEDFDGSRKVTHWMPMPDAPKGD